jgi:hypothetical protein
MLRLSSDRVEYRIDGGHGIFELCSLVVHDDLGPEAANIVEIGRPSGCENLQFCLCALNGSMQRSSSQILDKARRLLLACHIGLRSNSFGGRRGQCIRLLVPNLTVSIAPCDRLLPMFQLRTFHGQTARNPKVRVADYPGVERLAGTLRHFFHQLRPSVWWRWLMQAQPHASRRFWAYNASCFQGQRGNSD